MVNAVNFSDEFNPEKKENCGGSPVSYWKVINAKGELEAKFHHQLNADAFVTSSPCPYLYKIIPVWEDEIK